VLISHGNVPDPETPFSEKAHTCRCQGILFVSKTELAMIVLSRRKELARI
jgi:hypothetical protein